ncbi:MAG: hypothetical protein RR768_05360 [Clostridium sp.]
MRILSMEDSYLKHNELIEVAIEMFYQDSSKDNLVKLLEAIRNRMNKDAFLEAVVDMEHIDGVVLNPWDKFFLLDKELIKTLMDANKEPKPENHIFFDVGDITKLNCECIVIYSCFNQDTYDMFQSFIELVKKGDW